MWEKNNNFSEFKAIDEETFTIYDVFKEMP